MSDRQSADPEHLAVVSFSGGIGERIICGPTPFNDHSDYSDWKSARLFLRKCTPAEFLDWQMQQATKRAECLVRSYRDEIHLVADALLRLQTLTGDEIAALIDFD
jgi:hypothetical protein